MVVCTSFQVSRLKVGRSPGVVFQAARLRPVARQHRQLRVYSQQQSGFVEGLINSLTQAIANSPINEYKIKLAKFQAGSYDEVAVKAKVDKYIADNPVTMFSFSTCPFCKRAKGLLDDMAVPYTAIELDQMGKEGLEMRAELAKMTSRTSMPNIFIGGKSVGGCNDGPGIMTLNKQGKLDQLLQDAGASPKGGVSPPASSQAEAVPIESDQLAEATQWVENWKAKKQQ
eukprot:TRINITY_DN3591_c1_g1_i1.p2 TRINITY_DN3591_c1_g1~~TRINITY_DN3591_c1_g1_i1.p2  ORF type:complete len:262 (+),score=25.07 TRINITY_DN3591_c1_g1_i1:104-787(+)